MERWSTFGPDTEPIVAERLAVLQIIRLRGRVAMTDVASSCGFDQRSVTDLVAHLVDEGRVQENRGRVRLTDSGRAELAALIAHEREGINSSALTEAYEDFHAVNTAFKQLVTDWQLVDGDTANDHTDPAYDARIIERLNALHGEFSPLLNRMAVLAPRLQMYPRRFEDALSKVNGGDHSWLARPLIDSYHTAWFELHEDLIGLCGLTRIEEAAAGRAQ